MAKTHKREAAKEFASNWKGRGYEKGDAQVFWTELLQQVVGLDRISQRCKFEFRTSSGGFIDCLIPDPGVIIEQKGLGTDLDRLEERQGRMVTPFEQALAYRDCLADPPRFIVVCDFGTFRVHDTQGVARTDYASHYLEFSLEDLGENPHLMDFISNPDNSRAEREKAVSIAAGERVGQLFGMLREQYLDPESEESQHALNVLCVRLVFCLFCEDADLFEKDALLNFLRRTEPQDIRRELRDLFKALDTPVAERDPYDDRFKGFPYVNGGLFAGEVEIPNFTPDMKFALLFDISQQTDWSQISPTIFGGIFESTLNPETRHAGGMHYTSPENIHKVIDPLFLDGLRAEFDSIRLDAASTPRKRKSALRRFHDKIASLNFLDPACGSGNFLTETYLCLRELEDDVLNALNDGQIEIAFDFGDDDGEEMSTGSKRVSLDQFYGIEINDFAASVANTALWIAQLQANRRSEMLMAVDIEDFPLRDHARIHVGNALRTDWNDILPAEQCDYIMGNPPFLGAKIMNAEQKKDVLSLFGKTKLASSVDYVSAWYLKAAKLMEDNDEIRAAFVSTNSICQGQQVAPVWGTLINRHSVDINFAHRTFIWDSEASEKAHVHVIIVGFSRCSNGNKVIYNDGAASVAKNINPYLVDAPNVIVTTASRPISREAPECDYGSLINDGGNYIFKPNELETFLAKEPLAEKYVRPLVGAEELIKGKKRFILYLRDVTPSEIIKMPEVKRRILAVQEQRANSTAAATRKTADTPQQFYFDSTSEHSFLAIPSVSSERRKYVPMEMFDSSAVATNLVSVVKDPSLYLFGLLNSQAHNAWMRVVAGRLKSDYRYTPKVVYNTFPWPNPDCEIRSEIENMASKVLEARKLYEGSSLAVMYDPDNEFLFPELIHAHTSLDAAVEAAYGVDFNGDEEKIVAHLFKLYAQLTSE